MQNQDDDNNETIKDEQVRKHIQTLSERFYDLKERFAKIIHKINQDADGFADQISDEDDTTDDDDDESTDDMSVDEDSDSTKASNDDEEEEEEEDNKQTEKILIQYILESKARRYEYLKNVIKYPKIMKYLLNNDPNCLHIPLRYLEPFIQKYVEKNPNAKIYDKINQQIQDIRHSYLNNRQ